MPETPKQKRSSSLIKEMMDGPVSIAINGHCMQPVLQHGSRVSVQPAQIYWPGDILVFAKPDEQLLSHRLIGVLSRYDKLRTPRKRRTCFLTKADNSNQPDGWIVRDQIIGKVVIEVPVTTRLSCTLWFSRYLLAALFRRLTRC